MELIRRSLTAVAVVAVLTSRASATPTVTPQTFIAAGYASPTALSGQVDDYAITAIGQRLDCTTGPGVCIITGLTGCTFDGRIAAITNTSTVTSHDITLKNNDAWSLPENRIVLNDDQDVVVGAGRVYVLRCDVTGPRWRPLASENAVTVASQFALRETTFSTTGNIYDFALDSATSSLVWTGTTTARLKGITGGYPGRTIFVTNQSANHSVLFLDDDDGNETLSNRILGTGGHNLPLRNDVVNINGNNGGGPSAGNGAFLVYNSNRWQVGAASTTQINHQIILNSALISMFGTSAFDAAGGTDPALTSCGTSPTIVGANAGGTVTIGTGGAGCVITFAQTSTWASRPACVVQNHTSAARNAALLATVTATTITINAGGATDGDVVDYWCIKAGT